MTTSTVTYVDYKDLQVVAAYSIATQDVPTSDLPTSNSFYDESFVPSKE